MIGDSAHVYGFGFDKGGVCVMCGQSTSASGDMTACAEWVGFNPAEHAGGLIPLQGHVLTTAMSLPPRVPAAFVPTALVRPPALLCAQL